MYIFPYGSEGIEAHLFLEKKYGVAINIKPVDSNLCYINKDVISIETLKEYDWENSNGVCIVTAIDIKIYSLIRTIVYDVVPRNRIIDVCPFNPLCKFEDNRIASMALAAREIYAKKIKGSIAEAGVYRGDTTQYINMLFPDRKLYLFDSFTGFADDCIKEGDNRKQVENWEWSLSDTSVKTVLEKLTYKDNIVVKKGYVPETLDGIDDTFAFVSLDMDLYKPTNDALNFFYNRLSHCGYIYIHDFRLWDGITNAVIKFCDENNIGYVCCQDMASVIITK